MMGFQAALQYINSKYVRTVAPAFQASRQNSAVKGTIRFLLLISVLVVSCDCQAAGSPIGKVTDVHGTATIKRPGFEKRCLAAKGDSVAVGDEVLTEKDSLVQVSFADDSFMHVFPGSRMRVNQYDFNIEQNRRSSRIGLLRGRARFVLYKARSGDSAFYVETKNAIVAAGPLGDFVVSVDASRTEVAALNGSIRIRNSSKLVVGEINLGMNQKTYVEDKIPPAQPVILSPEERQTMKKNLRSSSK